MNSILANTIILQFPLFSCCTHQPLGKCLENLMGIIQIGVQWCCFMTMIILFVLYFPQDRKFLQLIGDARKNVPTYEWKKALIIGFTVFCYFCSVVIASSMLLSFIGDAEQNASTEYFADSLGLLSMVMSTIQFLPQLVQTWQEQVCLLCGHAPLNSFFV